MRESGWETRVREQVKRMLVPRFTIRSALFGVTLCALVFLIVGFGFRGDNFAWAFTIGLVSLAVTALVHAAWFAVVWLFAQLPSAQPITATSPARFDGLSGQPATDEQGAKPGN